MLLLHLVMGGGDGDYKHLNTKIPSSEGVEWPGKKHVALPTSLT
jgi:hypothetical protein